MTLAIGNVVERKNGNALGVCLQVTEQCGPLDLKKAGESMALKRRPDAAQVWVWVWAHDMDMHGPAACVSYVADGPVVTEFVDPRAIAMWYLKERYGGMGAPN